MSVATEKPKPKHGSKPIQTENTLIWGQSIVVLSPKGSKHSSQITLTVDQAKALRRELDVIIASAEAGGKG